MNVARSDKNIMLKKKSRNEIYYQKLVGRFERKPMNSLITLPFSLSKINMILYVSAT